MANRVIHFEIQADDLGRARGLQRLDIGKRAIFALHHTAPQPQLVGCQRFVRLVPVTVKILTRQPHAGLYAVTDRNRFFRGGDNQKIFVAQMSGKIIFAAQFAHAFFDSHQAQAAANVTVRNTPGERTSGWRKAGLTSERGHSEIQYVACTAESVRRCRQCSSTPIEGGDPLAAPAGGGLAAGS